MEISEKALADSLFFSKEAANYLGISTQRLNKLVQLERIRPLKKSSSGMVFLKGELDRRKEELAIFSREAAPSGASGHFAIDSDVKQEALNYAILFNITGQREKALEQQIKELEECIDLAVPLLDDSVVDLYCRKFDISRDNLIKEYEYATQMFSKLRETDVILRKGDPDYPQLLAATEHAPRFLYLRGRISLLNEKRTVALVGSRDASAEWMNNTKKLAKRLGANGITVVSGLAKGIDVSAHTSALENHYNTIAVIGTNLNQYYPSDNRKVQETIEKKGLVVSQFSPATKTQRWFFPLRNSVMSGLSLATVVMEAGETSGALRQADYALKQGRIVMLPKRAVDNPNLAWPKRFVARGAVVIDRPSDVVAYLAKSNIYQRDLECKQMSLENSAPDKNEKMEYRSWNPIVIED